MRFLKEQKEFIFLFLLCLCIFAFNLALEYKEFLKFKEQKHVFLQTKVLQSYAKTNAKGRSYRVLKLETSNFSFYTTTKLDNNISRHQILSLRAITTKVSFKDFISKSFYMPSYDFKVLEEENFKHSIIPYFLNQHQNEKIKEFYGALFFALPVSLELRTDVNFYGIAHLIAISGYHIALIFSLIFFFFAPLYSFFQQRFFPYRNLRLDLSVIIFIFLLFYAYLLGFVPSYIRSLVMALFGFYLLAKNVRILSFVNLFFCVLICIGLFPQLLFSVGFLFSVMGVYFIFLYMHHFSRHFGNFTNVVLLNIWTFFAMIIPVLYFFPLISFQQILAIFLSVVFVIFYPLVLFLHFISFGNLLDEALLTFLNFKFSGKDCELSLWIFLSYLFLSLFSIFSKKLALLVILLNLIPFIWLYFSN
ncbi:competence protein [Campylobacter sp. MIT 99-7217]|uniref:ComEC/Rec2 family competence protein n=1 Tax=Campylobacter sp. MIT 99-7217 TaxID=535091 RepID=UPI00115710F0|nr:ComEC/Rec2 family competence protein [Campylobacter sp. MIT 99-7217]TQR33062.1 competence protein [Campylobacter sp. MIT 99-7217]